MPSPPGGDFEIYNIAPEPEPFSEIIDIPQTLLGRYKMSTKNTSMLPVLLARSAENITIIQPQSQSA